MCSFWWNKDLKKYKTLKISYKSENKSSKISVYTIQYKRTCSIVLHRRSHSVVSNNRLLLPVSLCVITRTELWRPGCVKGSVLPWRPLQMLTEEQGHNEVGFPVPSSACGLYLGSAVREWEPNSTQGVCGSRSSPPTLLSAFCRSFHRACTVTHSPHREEVGLTD